MIYETIIKIAIILVPTWCTAYITDKMIYVIPMLAACTVVATSLFTSNDARNRRVEEDGFKKDIEDWGSRKDDG